MLKLKHKITLALPYLKIGIIEAQDISKDFKGCTKTTDADSLNFLKYGLSINDQPQDSQVS